MIKPQALTFYGHEIVRAIYIPVTIISGEKKETVQAVWDTGATGTCISTKIASKLGLIPISQSEKQSAAGTFIGNDYIIDLLINNAVLIKDVRVSDFAGSDKVDALIGMDIITLGDMAITNGRGETVMSFRIPPDATSHIDYVMQQHKADKNTEAIKQFKKKMKKRK